ncbi:uncharacterized protein LOC120740793 [Simochromis diagramma]|uniref:uncharacterized protein LOC120740793 n=1 Tax=Simochromis diagramma TaxID=43689 RepID=UPI001A7E7ACF|nr:uncharacterized protein LOC120740793 [Simochromis diagramma]
MKMLSVVLLHGVCVLHLSALTVSAVSLSVNPDQKQFFSRGGLVILTCVDGDGKTVDEWTVKRTTGTLTEMCGAAAGLVIIKSLCQLKLRNPSDGAYFCESSSGQRSDEVNIVVSAGSLILKAPSFPVWTGSNEILLCQFKDLGNFSLYKDDPPTDPPPNVKAPPTTTPKTTTHTISTTTPHTTIKKTPCATSKSKKQDEENGWYWSPSSGPPLTASIMSGLVSVVLLVLV